MPGCICRRSPTRRASGTRSTTSPEIFKETPYIADLMPGGKHTARAMYEAGGVGVVIKELLDAGLLEGDCLTVTGKTLRENYADVRFPEDQDVFYRVAEPAVGDRRRRGAQGQPGAGMARS